MSHASLDHDHPCRALPDCPLALGSATQSAGGVAKCVGRIGTYCKNAVASGRASQNIHPGQIERRLRAAASRFQAPEQS
jgi:hypothetical protein